MREPYSTPEGNVKAIVSVSGGLDSTACLYHAVHLWGTHNVIGVSFDYGQRHNKEVEIARDFCRKLDVEHDIQDVTGLFAEYNGSLSAGSSKQVTQGQSYVQETQGGKIANEYVPNRNSTFGNLLALYGMLRYPEDNIVVVMGMHTDDVRVAYPDCSLKFAEYLNSTLMEGTGGRACLYTPLINFTKADVVGFGRQYGMTLDDFDHTWSCYVGGERHCGKCPTCIDRIKALLKAGVYHTVGDITSRYDIGDYEAKKFFDTLIY